MADQLPKVKFAVGGEVSMTKLSFKSSFARALEVSSRDAKSLDTKFMCNGTIPEELANPYTDDTQNNYFSLKNFEATDQGSTNGPESLTWHNFNEASNLE